VLALTSLDELGCDVSQLLQRGVVDVFATHLDG
jgi:hypothetical protein